MSLKDTIRGAREEASANGNPFERGSKDASADKQAQADERKSSAGFERRSAARAKPTREASAGVRVVSSKGKPKKSQMTKEEKKAERKREREIEDRRYNVSQMILEENEEYKRMRKIWWIFLIAGVVLMVIALGLYGMVTSSGNPDTTMSFLAMGSMVAAYIVVICGLIFDWVKIRPLRKEASDRAQSMTDKRLRTKLVQKAKKDEAEKERKKKRA